MAQHLKQHGWQYIVVDIQWSEPHPRRRLPPGRGAGNRCERQTHPRRRPLSLRRRGPRLPPLADYVHSLGLRFGIHIMRGIPAKP